MRCGMRSAKTFYTQFDLYWNRSWHTGPLELPAGRLHNPPNLPGWDGFDLRCELEKKLQRGVVVESDANLAALAECFLGRGSRWASIRCACSRLEPA